MNVTARGPVTLVTRLNLQESLTHIELEIYDLDETMCDKGDIQRT